MIDLGTLGNNNQGGLKAESWAGATKLTPGDGVMSFLQLGSTWQTVSFNYTMEPGTDSLKVVLLNVNYNGKGTAKYGFDNVEILIPGGTPALRLFPSSAVISRRSMMFLVGRIPIPIALVTF
jgi:hypothetical protein